MSAAAYKKLRIVIGALTFVSCALVFADIGGLIPSRFINIALWLQFAPSLLSFVQGASWVTAGFIAVILLTLLFGRVYCAMLCPLGVAMDFSAWLSRRTGKKRKLVYQPGHTKIRVFVIVLCALGLALGTAVPLGLLDPYSIFGKITAGSLRPLHGWVNHFLSGNDWARPIDVSPIAWTSIGVSLTLLIAVVLSAVYRGRLWCNTVCPVGAVLGFLSSFSVFRLSISSNVCVSCSMCQRVCPSQCIDFKNHKIDHTRCTMCLDCVSFCGLSGIHFTRRKNGKNLQEKKVYKKTEESSPVESKDKIGSIPALPPASRRLFLASAITLPAIILAKSDCTSSRCGEEGGGCGDGGCGDGGCGDGGCGDGGCEDKHNGYTSKGPNRLTQFNKRPVLPPGAQSLAHFQNLCTACQLCVVHCPDQVLRPSITKHGLAGFLQPYQDFETSFCSYNCSKCSEVCPTDAIKPISIEERRSVRTGVAILFRSRCVVKTDGTSCGACSEHCPTQAVHMVPWKNGLTIPQMDPELCIGCGGCEFICPVRSDKAIIVTGLLEHEKATPVDIGVKNTIRQVEEDFPF